MSKLVLVRHGESEWNQQNRFTGWVDVPLTEKGRAEARAAAGQIKEIRFDQAYTSELERAQETLKIILEETGQAQLGTMRDKALNERHYGDLQGLDKAETVRKFGEKQVHIWRRSYDTAPPNGESLKDTAARTLPYFEDKIMKGIREGKNIIVSAHGNSLRSIVMDLDKLSRDEVLELNIPTGVPIVYEFSNDGKILSKKILKTD